MTFAPGHHAYTPTQHAPGFSAPMPHPSDEQAEWYAAKFAEGEQPPAPKQREGITAEVEKLEAAEQAEDLSLYIETIRDDYENRARPIDIRAACRKARRSLDDWERDRQAYGEFMRLRDVAATEAEARKQEAALQGEVTAANETLATAAEALRIAQRDHDIAALYARRAEEARERHNDGPLSKIREAKRLLRESATFSLFRDSSIDEANAEALRIGAAEGAAQRRTDKIKADLESAEFELSASIAHEKGLRHSHSLLKRDRGVDLPVVERRIDDTVQRIASLRKQVPQLRRSYEQAKAEEKRLAEEYSEANKAAALKADELILS